MGEPPDCGSPRAITMDQLLKSPGPKYLTISSTDPGLDLKNINPFIVKEQIDLTCDGEIEECKTLRNGTLLVKTKTSLQASKLLKLKAFAANNNVTVSVHNSLNTTKGVIYSNDLRGIEENVIVQELATQLVTDVRKIVTRDDGSLKETGLLILTFNTHNLPEYVMIGYQRTAVRMYIPLPMRCNSCFKYGHLHKFCKNNKLCYNCGEEHHIDTATNDKCSRPQRCINCNVDQLESPHNSVSKKCPVFLRQQELQAIKTMHKCDNKTAHTILKAHYSDETPHLYSSIAKKSNHQQLNSLTGPQQLTGPGDHEQSNSQQSDKATGPQQLKGPGHSNHEKPTSRPPTTPCADLYPNTSKALTHSNTPQTTKTTKVLSKNTPKRLMSPTKIDAKKPKRNINPDTLSDSGEMDIL